MNVLLVQTPQWNENNSTCCESSTFEYFTRFDEITFWWLSLTGRISFGHGRCWFSVSVQRLQLSGRYTHEDQRVHGSDQSLCSNCAVRLTAFVYVEQLQCKHDRSDKLDDLGPSGSDHSAVFRRNEKITYLGHYRRKIRPGIYTETF